MVHQISDVPAAVGGGTSAIVAGTSSKTVHQILMYHVVAVVGARDPTRGVGVMKRWGVREVVVVLSR